MAAGELNTDVGFTNPVVISAVVISGVTASQAMITWTTQIPASTQLSWGLAPNEDQVTAETDTNPLATSHTVSLTGLQNSRAYLFHCISRQDSGRDGMNRTVMDGYQARYQGAFGSGLGTYAAFALTSPDTTRWVITVQPTGNLTSTQQASGPANVYDTGFLVLTDANGVNWTVTINSLGDLITTSGGNAAQALPSLLLLDANSRIWTLTVSITGDLVTT